MSGYYDDYNRSTREEKIELLVRLINAHDVSPHEKMIIGIELQKVLAQPKNDGSI